jgi:hypothetical protein
VIRCHTSPVGVPVVLVLAYRRVGAKAPQSPTHGQRRAARAEVLAALAAPAMLFDTADLDVVVGPGADENALRENPVLPAALERALEQEDRVARVGHRRLSTQGRPSCPSPCRRRESSSVRAGPAERRSRSEDGERAGLDWSR